MGICLMIGIADVHLERLAGIRGSEDGGGRISERGSMLLRSCGWKDEGAFPLCGKGTELWTPCLLQLEMLNKTVAAQLTGQTVVFSC